MKTYKPSDLRVVGLFGHRGSGKTTLAESFLFNGKVTTRMGNVEAGNLTLEIDEVALERQTTMQVNPGFVEWNGCRISMLDTPGDGNFWGATARAIEVVDSALVTVNGTEGVENVTLRAIQGLKARDVPLAVFVTRLDKEAADFDAIMQEVKEEVSKNAVAVSLPIGAGPEMKGVVSLLSQKAYLADGDTYKETDIPADMADAVESARELVFDAVAAADDDLAEKYLEELTLSDEELSRGLKAAFASGDIVPVFAGIPTLNLGANIALDCIGAAFPSPLDRPAVKGYESFKQETEVERPPDPDGPLAVRVFRTYHDPFAGTLSFGRVWSGSIKGAADLYNSTSGNSDRSSHMYLPQGGTKAGAEIKEASVGDVLVFTKLKSTSTGDTLSTKDAPTFMPAFDEPDALLNFGLSAAEQKDEDKLSGFVHKRVEEDPSLRFERDPESKEMLLGGLGQAHIDYVIDRLKRSGIQATLREPKVPYRETLRAPIMGVEGKHKKQTGGHGQVGVCFVNVEPTARGTGFVFVDQIVGGAIPRGFIPSVEKGIRDSFKGGPLSGSPIVDLRVSLYDGKYHRVDSSDMAFQTAGRKAIKAVFDSPKAKPVLLEPYMELDIACPADNVGDVMGDLNSRRARVNNMTTEGRRGKISCSVPMNEILRYTNVLKSITSGRGSFTMKFDRYEEAPPNVQQQVTAAYEASMEKD